MIIAVILLSGCSYAIKTSENYVMDHTEYFETPEEVMEWVALNIKYKSDSWIPRNDYWQSPDQTYEWRTGDCEDYAILFAYFVHELGYDPVLTATETHAMTRIGNIVYDVGGNYTIDLSKVDVIFEIEYNELIYMTEKYHDNYTNFYM